MLLRTLSSVLPLALLLLISGCATSSPIKRYGESRSAFGRGPELMAHNVPPKDIYRIYHKASTGFVSLEAIRESAEARAEEFCVRQGKGMLVLGEKASQPPYILGNFPRIEIVFAAVDKPKQSSGTGATGVNSYEKLTTLKRLLDEGALTEDEFEREKRKVLNQQ